MKNLLVIYFVVFLMITSLQAQWDILNEGGNFNKIYFANDSVGWIAGGNKIFKSEDGGNTWYKIFVTDSLNIYKIDFFNETVGWAITRWTPSFILKTEYGGNTWNIQKELPEEVYLRDIHVVNDNTVYISAATVDWQNNIPKFLKTVDGGNHWIEIPRNENLRTYQSIWFQDADNGIIVGTEDEIPNPVNSIILRTNDGGNTFNETVIPNIEMGDFQIMNDSTAYFLGGNFINVTNDTLNSWTQLTYNNLNIQSFFIFDDTHFFAIMYDDTSKRFMTSTDGGLTWDQKNLLSWFGAGGSLECDIFFRNADVGFVVGGNRLSDKKGYYLLQTFDGGSEWEIQKFNIPLQDIYFIDRYKGFACGGYIGLFLDPPWGAMIGTEDGGQSWNKSKSPGGDVCKIVFVDSLIGYTLSYSGGGWWIGMNIHKTIDGGNSWDLKLNRSHHVINDLSFRNSQLGWLAGWFNDTTGIKKTIDGGDTWECIWGNTGYNGLNSIYDIEGTLWAVGNGGLIITSVSTDSFKIVNGVTSLDLNKVFFSDAMHGWIIGGSSSVFKTINSGQTWIEKQFNNYLVFDMYFADSLQGWAVGSDDTTSLWNFTTGSISGNGVILNTIDGGKNWTVQIEDLPVPLSTIHFKDGYGWVAGWNGLILRTDDGASWIDQKTGKTYPNKYTLKQNYPNPFNPRTNIQFSIPKTEFVTLEIYNLLGQKVATLVSEKLTSGNYKYTWDASTFASGVYYYRIAIHSDKIEVGSKVQTRKLILMK